MGLLLSNQLLQHLPHSRCGILLEAGDLDALGEHAVSHPLDLSTVGRPERQLQQPWGHPIDTQLIALAPHCWVDLERKSRNATLAVSLTSLKTVASWKDSPGLSGKLERPGRTSSSKAVSVLRRFCAKRGTSCTGMQRISDMSCISSGLSFSKNIVSMLLHEI